MEPDGPEHPNVALVRANLAKVMAGDIDGALEDWAEGGRYHAFDADGIESRDISGVAEIVTAGRRLLEHHENELVEVRAIGDELVSLHLRVHARSHTQRTMSAEYLIVLNVRDGKIRWACDFIDTSIQAFLDEAWSAPADEG
jgi:ketosteroid isomerase-like protein